MLTSMSTAVSGMDAAGTDLSVVSNNIANLNTIGFKSSSVSFGDVLSQNLADSTGTSQVGLGVQVMSVTPQFTQGSFESTSNGLDMAVDGSGFFMVNDSSGNTYYTRDGEFSTDANGNIVNPSNMMVQGYLADAAGNITNTIGNLQITGNSPANMTTEEQVSVNLDATSTPPAAPFTLDGNATGVDDDPANYNFSDATTVYDSQGGAHQVTMYFVNTGANAWTVHYVVADPDNPGSYMEAGQTSGGAGNLPTGAATTQNLTFNANGSLNNDNSGTAMDFNFGGGVTNPQPVAFNFGTGTGEVPAGTGLDMSTQFASASSVANVTQDGYTAGSLQSVSISQAGIVSGVFSNGETRNIGQIALAGFNAPTGLNLLGKNLYSASAASGQANIGKANTGGLGQINSSSLEQSNVDLDQEFVNMIAAQRTFEANSKVITTTDQMLQVLVNLTS